MKRSVILLTAISAVVLMSFVNMNLHTDKYRVDPARSNLEWQAEKLSGKHNGTIKVSNGEIRDDHGKLTGKIEMDMTSIEDKDMEAGVYKTKLENHLKSADFFDVANFPKSTFQLTSVSPISGAKHGESTHKIKGMLTIKNKTNEITFDAIIGIQPNIMTCVGSAIVDRSKFDVKYGSKSFFEDIGDKMIYDEFTLKFNLVATN